MKWLIKNPPLLILIVVCLLSVVAIRSAWAQGDHECQGNSCNNSGTPASAVVNSGRSIGIGGADYDIGRGSCKFHVGGLTVAIARTDEFCEGMEMIRAGMVDAGILHLCKQSTVGKNYADLKDCQANIVITTNLIPIETELVVKDDDEDDERYLEQQQENEYAREERASLIGQIDRLTQQIERAPAARPQINDGSARRAKSRAAYEKALAEGTE